jgi:hypothetical protein
MAMDLPFGQTYNQNYQAQRGKAAAPVNFSPQPIEELRSASYQPIEELRSAFLLANRGSSGQLPSSQ